MADAWVHMGGVEDVDLIEDRRAYVVLYYLAHWRVALGFRRCTVLYQSDLACEAFLDIVWAMAIDRARGLTLGRQYEPALVTATPTAICTRVQLYSPPKRRTQHVELVF